MPRDLFERKPEEAIEIKSPSNEQKLVIDHLEALITRVKRGESFEFGLSQAVTPVGDGTVRCGSVTTSITMKPKGAK